MMIYTFGRVGAVIKMRVEANKTLTLEGTVKTVDWGNPHVTFVRAPRYYCALAGREIPSSAASASASFATHEATAPATDA